MGIECSEVSSGDSTFVPQQEVGHQPVMRHRRTRWNGAQRRMLGPIQERGPQYKRVCRIEEDVEVVSDSGALSDGHIDRSRRVRHCEKR